MVEVETKAESINDVCERLAEDLGHQSTESINIGKASEIYSKGGAAEEEHGVKNETKAENSNDDHERLTGGLGH